jgi:hypothetical protein
MVIEFHNMYVFVLICGEAGGELLMIGALHGNIKQ